MAEINLSNILTDTVGNKVELGALISGVVGAIAYLFKIFKGDKSKIKKFEDTFVDDSDGIYELNKHLQSDELNEFYKSFDDLIDRHRKKNKGIILKLVETEDMTGEVARDFKKCIVDLLADNRVRLKVIFPEKSTLKNNMIQLFEELQYLTDKKDTINIIDDQYVKIVEDRRS